MCLEFLFQRQISSLADKTEEAKKLRDERLREEIKKLDAKYKNQHVIAVISKGGNETVIIFW